MGLSSAETPDCYTTDSQARCLRVEITATNSLLLPLDEFIFAELNGENNGQKLRLVFATHEILIAGYVLRRIEVAMQRMELSGIMRLPEKHHASLGEGQPKITEIEVAERKSADSQPQGSVD